MEELLEILRDIDPDNDYEYDERLIDDGHLDSLSLLQLVTELEDTFEIQVTPTELIPPTSTPPRLFGPWSSGCNRKAK